MLGILMEITRVAVVMRLMALPLPGGGLAAPDVRPVAGVAGWGEVGAGG